MNKLSDADINENNKFFSENIKEKLGLKYSPVAIKFILNESDIPEGINQIDENLRHCEFVKIAAEGKSFYATAENQTCKGGSAAIGLDEIPPKIADGEFYYKLGRFKSIGSAKRTYDKIPKVDIRSYALVYTPLEDAKFQPDIVLIITNPKGGMTVSQALVYTLGGRINANFSGIQSLCADAVAGPFTTKEPNITLACSGSRKFAKIADDELVVGLTGENIGCFVNALLEAKF
ncbi:MAG: DUF169 domain-containing protein [Methanobrevibacter sp.]|jgi:uncharacterized protein (DUF169 family)|nr:DUF169 domain-containing protein [Candidatus Methanoflexus mossambicus]